MEKVPPLSDKEKEVYSWQTTINDLGEEGQRKLKGSSVMISRCGGVGGQVALQLAAAGVGRLVIAHGGDLKPSDLNRQLLMTDNWIGRPRIENIVRRLKELNPRLEIIAEPANVTEDNIERLVRDSDLIVDCAPLFEERYLMNSEAIKRGKPMVECAMYDMDFTVTSFYPGKSPCLVCYCPEIPAWWKRRFPVLGAVSGTAGAIGAVEAVKILTGLGTPLYGTLLHAELRIMRFRCLKISRDPDCKVCRHL